MTLKSLSQLGRVEKKFDILKDLNVTLHTLSVTEQQNALAVIPDSIDNEVTRFAYLQESLLTHATSHINGEAVTAADAKEFYSNLQYNVLTEIFAKFVEITGEQSTLMEDLKKK